MTYKDGSKTTGGSHYSQSKGLKDQVRRKFNHTCQICGRPGNDVDHIIPWAESHDSTLSNLRVLCHSCNCWLRNYKPKRKNLPLNQWFDWLDEEIKKGQEGKQVT